jgi:hypothetical protein
LNRIKSSARLLAATGRGEMCSALPGNRETEKRGFLIELTIASVKENDMKPIAMDAMLIGARDMARVGHQPMRDNVG